MALVWLCMEGRGGTAVWLYEDKSLRSSIVSPYLGHGSVLTKHHYSPSPCLYGHIMRMFSWAQQRNRVGELPQKTMSLCRECLEFLWGKQNEWICLNILCGDTVFLWVVCVSANIDRLSFIPGLGSTFCQSFCWSLLKHCSAGPITRDHQLYRSRHFST